MHKRLPFLLIMISCLLSLLGQHNIFAQENQRGMVSWTPANPTTNDIISITFDDVLIGARLHWGVQVSNNVWLQPINDYWPASTVLFEGTGPAVQSPFTGPDINSELHIQIGPFNNGTQVPEGINFVINFNDDTWDDNSGMDYYIPVSFAPPLGINDIGTQRIKIYPNPTPDVLNIEISTSDKMTLELTNLAGRLIEKLAVYSNNSSLDLSQLGAGIYLISLLDLKGNVLLTERIVKQ